jgi:hypothetical protein
MPQDFLNRNLTARPFREQAGAERPRDEFLRVGGGQAEHAQHLSGHRVGPLRGIKVGVLFQELEETEQRCPGRALHAAEVRRVPLDAEVRATIDHGNATALFPRLKERRGA